MKAKRFFRIIATVVTAVTLFASFPVYAEGEWPGEDCSMTEMDSVVRSIEDVDELSENQKNAEVADISQEEFVLLNPEYVEIDDISLEEFVLQNSP